MAEFKAYAVTRTGGVEVRDDLSFDPDTQRISGQLSYTGYFLRLVLERPGEDDWEYVFDPPMAVRLGADIIDWPLDATEPRVTLDPNFKPPQLEGQEPP